MLRLIRSIPAALLLLLLCFLPPGLAESTEQSVVLSADSVFTFTPAANGEYGFYYFSDAGPMGVRLSLYQDGSLLLYGENAVRMMTTRLNASTTYTIEVTGGTGGHAEVTRETLSRCFSQPLPLEETDTYTKRIARSGDCHWYSVTPEINGVLMTTVTDITAELAAFDARGIPIGTAQTLASGTALLYLPISAGNPIYLRVSDRSGLCGNYTIRTACSSLSGYPEQILLSATELPITGRSTARIDVALSPFNACPLLYCESSDSSIVTSSGIVNSHLLLTGGAPGEADVTIYGPCEATARCHITVGYQPVTGIRAADPELLISLGDVVPSGIRLQPESATDRAYTCTSSDETVVTITEGNRLVGIGTGSAIVTATTHDGAFTMQLSVTVQPAPPQYRALILSEVNYAPGIESIRLGSTESAEAVQTLLEGLSFEGNLYSVNLLQDASRDTIVRELRHTFAGMTDSSVSLIYITCHGFYSAGMTQLLCVDGSVLSAAELSRELSDIPGTVILMLDFCASGGFIARATDPTDIADAVTRAFSGAIGPAELTAGNCYVIASAYLDQDSLRIGQTGMDMTTVFSNALCAAAERTDGRAAADTDGDGAVDFSELRRFLAERVAYASREASGVAQRICSSPENSSIVVFDWSARE